MQFTTAIAVLALPFLAAASPAGTTTAKPSSTSLYNAPRPSGSPGFSFDYTYGATDGGYAGVTSGNAGGLVGGTVVPSQFAASGVATGAYNGASGVAYGSAAPTAGIGKLQGSAGNNGGILEASYGPGGVGGCGGYQVSGQGTTFCVKPREAKPTA